MEWFCIVPSHGWSITCQIVSPFLGSSGVPLEASLFGLNVFVDCMSLLCVHILVVYSLDSVCIAVRVWGWSDGRPWLL